MTAAEERLRRRIGRSLQLAATDWCTDRVLSATGDAPASALTAADILEIAVTRRTGALSTDTKMDGGAVCY
jgi:hypothetical protein